MFSPSAFVIFEFVFRRILMKKIFKKLLTWWHKRAIYDAHVSHKLLIAEVSHTGFMVEQLVGNRTRVYRWKTIHDLSVDLRRRLITITTNQEQQFLIPQANHVGWYYLLSHIPKGYPGFDYAGVAEFFKGLGPCYVCGGKAMENDVCLACNAVRPPELMDRGMYLHAQQLRYFSEQAGLALLNLYGPPPDGFEQVPDYKVLVTEEEVLNFVSKEV